MQQRIELMFGYISQFVDARACAIGLMAFGMFCSSSGDCVFGQFRDVTPRAETEEDREPLSPRPMENVISKETDSNTKTSRRHDANAKSKTTTSESASGKAQDPSETQAASELNQKQLAERQAKERKRREKELKQEIDSTLIDDTEVRQLPFRRITVGKSTEKDVIEAWGEPFKEGGTRRSAILKYRLDPFRQVDVTLYKDKVQAILIHLDGLLPPEQIERQLRMTKIRPAIVRDDYGRPIGMTYPERGVLLSFDASDPDALISKIQLEPISVESFLLRASNHRGQDYEANLDDLQRALEIEPNNAKAHWLRATQFALSGRFHDALGSSAKATHFDPENLEYRLTRIDLMATNGSRDMALRETRMILEQSEIAPEVRASATCLLGELIAGSEQPGANKLGMEQQLKAIAIAAKLVNQPEQSVRRSAKETLIRAHLAVARNISLGEFQKQKEVVPKWLSRARALVDDFVENEEGDRTLYLDLYRQILATAADIRNDEDPGYVIEQLQTEARQLIDQAKDPLYQANLQWKLGAGLAEAVRLQRQRGSTESAITLADAALELLKSSAKRRQSTPEQSYLIGRLYFHYGSLNAVQRKDHEEAVKWYRRAEPLLVGERPVAALGDPGTHGEMFVSMGVSYWENGDRQKAIDLTEFGTDFLQRAVVAGSLEPSVLSIPYNNLASMHKQNGNTQEARAFAELAAEVDQQSTLR